MSDAAGKRFWNATWDRLPPLTGYEGPVFEQHPVLYPFLSASGGGTAIEVGCVPGNWMVYLNKEFGYHVSGIDYSDRLDYVKANLRNAGITDFELIKRDLFDFEPTTLYDLVFSSGLAEHFDDHQLVVAKHAQLARPGGLVVIMVPNLRYIHRILCGLYHPEILAAHRFPLMQKVVLRRTLQEVGLEVLHCDYQRTFRPVYALPPALDFASRAIQKALRIFRLDNIGNRFGSPYLISVAKKK